MSSMGMYTQKLISDSLFAALKTPGNTLLALLGNQKLTIDLPCVQLFMA